MIPPEILISIFHFCQDVYKLTLVSDEFKRLIVCDRSFSVRLMNWSKTADFETCLRVLQSADCVEKIFVCSSAKRLAVLVNDLTELGNIINVIKCLKLADRQLFLIRFIRTVLTHNKQFFKKMTQHIKSLMMLIENSTICKVLIDNFIFFGNLQLVFLVDDLVCETCYIHDLTIEIKEELICRNPFQYDGILAQTGCMKLHGHPREIPNFVVYKNYHKLDTMETQILIIGALQRLDYKLLKKLIPKHFNCPGILFSYFPSTIEFFDIINNSTKRNYDLDHISEIIFQLSVKSYLRFNELEQFQYFLDMCKNKRTLLKNVYGALCDVNNIDEIFQLKTEMKKVLPVTSNHQNDEYFGHLNNIISSIRFLRLFRYLENNQDELAINLLSDYDIEQDMMIEDFVFKCLDLKKYETILKAIGRCKKLTPDHCILIVFTRFDDNIDFEFIKYMFNIFTIKKQTIINLTHTNESFNKWWNLFQNKIMLF